MSAHLRVTLTCEGCGFREEHTPPTPDDPQTWALAEAQVTQATTHRECDRPLRVETTEVEPSPEGAQPRVRQALDGGAPQLRRVAP